MKQSQERIYDLEERTAQFGESIIGFCKIIPQNAITYPIINQLVRSGTSVGANYYEANGAVSKKDFTNKIFLCKKEIKETAYWSRILIKAEPALKEASRDIAQEAKELTYIFAKISVKLREVE
jgi:four helix bundle protein